MTKAPSHGEIHALSHLSVMVVSSSWVKAGLRGASTSSERKKRSYALSESHRYADRTTSGETHAALTTASSSVSVRRT